MKIVACIFLLFLVFKTRAQDINWQLAHNWKMYKIGTGKGLTYSADTLSNFLFIGLNDDTIHQFIKQAEVLPKGKSYVWMGAYYATCILENKIHKVDISVHGGFFYDEPTKRYYQLPSYIRNEWMEWLITLKKRVNEK
ncbi:MAG TPA: hypothetical protein VK645_00430 [Chitinophagaceae bacterium]|nr:hypothetical protein [Chitinophagaceae bacterium]